MSSGFMGWAFAGAAALLAPMAGVAQDAPPPQDIGTSTPPELRDFRLDPAPPRPETRPEPQPEPQSESAPAPPVATAPPPQSAPQPARNPQRSPEPDRQQAPPPVEAAADATAVGETASPAAATNPAEGGTTTGSPAAKPATGSTADRAASYLPWLIAALATIMLAIGLGLLRRRRRSADALPEAAPTRQPSPPTRLSDSRPDTMPDAPRPPAPQAIFAEFRPESAQLSIASLTVTGRLILDNIGNAPVENLVLRSHMMSARPDQSAAIAAFHDDRQAGSIQPLGALARGERIEAIIEIRLPRSELPAFRWIEREFIAPIVLIHISGSADGDAFGIGLSHLIGRGAAGAARMKPLATDRGPKRFTGVSARPLFA